MKYPNRRYELWWTTADDFSPLASGEHRRHEKRVLPLGDECPVRSRAVDEAIKKVKEKLYGCKR